MSEHKHTPGPWVVLSFYKDGSHPFIQSTTDINHPRYLIASVQGNGMSITEQSANAKLIAAAPELLEALVQILGWRELRDGMEFPTERIEVIARAAIAKAKGETE